MTTGSQQTGYCAKCGASNPTTSTFCAKCGVLLSWAAQGTQSPATQPTSAFPASASAKSKASQSPMACCGLGCLGIVFAFIMFINSLGNYHDTSRSTAQSSLPSSSKKGSAAGSTEQANVRIEKIKGLGKREVGIVDKVWYVIEKTEKHKSIGNQFSSTHADGTFIVVRTAADNTDKETHSITTSLIKLLDDKGREFSPSTSGQVALSMSGDQSSQILIAEVQPDTWKRFTLIYDVPEDAKKFKLKIPSGMLSLDKEAIIKAP